MLCSHCLSLTNIESPLCASNHVYIVHILSITMLDDIESTSWRHRLPLLTLFTSFTSSKPQCCTISNQHRFTSDYLVNIVHIVDIDMFNDLLIDWFYCILNRIDNISAIYWRQFLTMLNQHRVDNIYIKCFCFVS